MQQLLRTDIKMLESLAGKVISTGIAIAADSMSVGMSRSKTPRTPRSGPLMDQLDTIRETLRSEYTRKLSEQDTIIASATRAQESIKSHYEAKLADLDGCIKKITDIIKF